MEVEEGKEGKLFGTEGSDWQPRRFNHRSPTPHSPAVAEQPADRPHGVRDPTWVCKDQPPLICAGSEPNGPRDTLIKDSPIT